MDLEVLVQVRLLSERLLATFETAGKGPFPRMHSQVVEEVVPLSEKEVTTIDFALQYFDVAVGARVLKLEHTEFACLWDFAYVESRLCQVDKWTRNHCHRRVGRYLLPQALAAQLVGVAESRALGLILHAR